MNMFAFFKHLSMENFLWKGQNSILFSQTWNYIVKWQKFITSVVSHQLDYK